MPETTGSKPANSIQRSSRAHPAKSVSGAEPSSRAATREPRPGTNRRPSGWTGAVAVNEMSCRSYPTVAASLPSVFASVAAASSGSSPCASVSLSVSGPPPAVPSTSSR
jgi:hypothetical protein